MARSFRHLFPMIGEVHDAVSVEIVRGRIHDASHDIVIEKHGIVVFIIHDFRSASDLALIFRPVVELGRIPVPIADVAAHQMDDDELAAVIRVDLLQVRDKHCIVVLGDDISADILVDPVLVVAGRSDCADRRIPDAEAGLVGNPCRMEASLPCHIDDGISIGKRHIIILVLFCQSFGQNLDGLRIAGVSMIEEYIMRIDGCL